MSTSPLPSEVPPLPDKLQTEGPVTLASIRKARMATLRGKSSNSIHYHEAAAELEVYLNFATYDISLWIGAVKAYLMDEGRTETVPPEIMNHLEEMLRELKLCGDIGNFAISQLVPRN